MGTIVPLYEAPKSLLKLILGDKVFLLINQDTAIYQDQTYKFDKSTKSLLNAHFTKTLLAKKLKKPHKVA